jgi:glycosyltransferase involved in cell wall biosynthesis
LKIVIVDTTLQGPLIGGAQTFLPSLIKGLHQHGHEIHLISTGKPDQRVSKQIESSGAILHTGLWNKRDFAEDAAPVFAKWINYLQPDIYLVSVSPDIGWLVLSYLEPAVATLTIGHTDDETFYAPARHYKRFVTKAIGVSHQVCSSYVSNCGFRDKDVQWIPYGVEAAPAIPVNAIGGPLKLIYAGRLEEHQKRVTDLGAIALGLSLLSLDYKLTIVGDGPERAKLERSLEKEVSNGKVNFTGWISGKKVLDLFRESEIFLLTSAYEGFCIALLEAMANGCCPVVTSIKSGNDELIEDGKQGFIVPVGGVNDFIGKIKYLDNNRDELLQLRQSAWQTAAKYSIDEMVKNYESCFSDAAITVRKITRYPDPAFPLMESCRSRYPKWLRRIKKLLKA